MPKPETTQTKTGRQSDFGCGTSDFTKVVTAAGIAPAIAWSQARHVAATLHGVAPAHLGKEAGVLVLVDTRPCSSLALPPRGRFLSLKLRVQNAEWREPMKHANLQRRTKQFALQVVKFCENLVKDETSAVLGRQLLRSGTSVGANYRAVCRAKSKADFISKFGTVLEEADESAFWIELLVDSGKTNSESAGPLLREANELVAISIASINTARGKS
jgi:four helix bundle protein